VTERVITQDDREFREALRLIQETNVHPGRAGYSATQLRQELEARGYEQLEEDALDGHPGVAVRAIKRRQAPVFGSDTIRQRGRDAIVAWVLLLAEAIRADKRRPRTR
jgi:hypothetical protein